jgi:Restriction endonuclease BglII
MHFVQAYSHHNGRDQWRDRELDEWLTDVFERPDLAVGPGSTAAIRDHVKNEFAAEGWAHDVKIDQQVDLTVFGVKDDLAFHLQTGNISRAAYDLLKLQHLYSARRITAAALALPTKVAANKIGSNIAHFERIMSELSIFDRTITAPIFLIAFE